MKHIEVFLLPILMLLDYFLTVVGAKLGDEKHRQHFKGSDYELNPRFQKSIAQKRWFSPRHLTAVVIAIVICWVWSSTWTDREPVYEAGLGFFLIFFTMIIGSQIF